MARPIQMHTVDEDEAPKKRREKPLYQVLQKCYLNDRIYDPEAMGYLPTDPGDEDAEPERKPLVIAFDGPPAFYMIPQNDAAREMVKKHPERMKFMDPVLQMAQINAPLPDNDAMIGMLAAALGNMARLNQPATPAA